MKIAEPSAADIEAATTGDLAALDRVLRAVQPGIYNLATRVLGQRDDAADATQEILLKLVTHLGGFRAEAAFATWAWKVAHNHLLTARTRRAESPEVSLEGLAERLQAGLDFGAERARHAGEPQPLTPEDKLEARQIALGCTQTMLMALGREQRLVYVLDTVFDLSSRDAAEVVGTTPQAYRQRLSRARARLDAFTGASCGLANPQAACRCEKQLPATRQLRSSGAPGLAPPLAIVPAELQQAQAQFAAFTRLSDAAALFRAHPAYQAPAAMLGAVRAVLRQEGFFEPRHLQ